ncbi:MAG: hypothetical protein J2P15_19340 [Micromonosporaceae bacterium]|nr:hypothetical protein [Micromonosporaceae bacterium]
MTPTQPVPDPVPAGGGYHRAARRLLVSTPGQWLGAVRRYRWIVLILALLCGGGALLGSAVQTPLYRASVQLLFSPNFPAPDVEQLNAGANYVIQRTAAYAQIADSPEVAAAVIGRLGLPTTPENLARRITVTPTAGAAVLEISVVDPDPGRARDIANAIGDVFPDFIQRLEKPTTGVVSPVKVSVARRAVTPSTPDTPHTVTNTGLGLGLGLGLGVLVAVVRYAGQRLVRDGSHAAELAGTALLGVPAGPGEVDPAHLAALAAGPATEALRQVRTDLLVHAAGRRLESITVVGAVAGEAIAAVVTMLGLAFVRAGDAVVLVDGDLRNPLLDKAFGVPAGTGLANVLGREASLIDVMQEWRPDLPLYLLPAGAPGSDPGEQLIRSAEMLAVLDEFRRGSVLAIVAAPPVLTDAEALVLADRTDATVLVARAGRTPADALATAAEALRSQHTCLLGVVAVR